MQLISIYCGLDTNGHDDIDARAVALELAAKWLPFGHTIIEATGRWSGQVGTVDEPTLIIQVFADRDSEARALAGEFKNRCFQESVAITRQEIEADFI